MSTQQQIAGKGHSNSNKRFRYTFISTDYGVLTLKTVPEEWAESELTFIRDPKYKGVLKSFSTNELTFPKEGRDYIERVYEAKGIDYEIRVIIELYINDFSYAPYFTGRLDLSTYKIADVGAKVKIIETGFQNTIINRENIKVDLLNTKFIGGGEGSMEQITGMPLEFTMPDYSASKDADWLIQGEKEETPTVYEHYLPMQVNSSDYPVGSAQEQTFEGTTPFYIADEIQDVTLKGEIQVEISDNASSEAISMEITIQLYKGEIVIQTYTDNAVGFDALFQFDVDEAISLLASDELSFRATITHDGEEVDTGYFNSSVTVSEALGEELLQQVVLGYPRYEFTTRILQLISGETNPLESTLIGRDDSTPTSYAEDGEGSLVVNTKGILIRDFPIEEGGTRVQTFNASLSDAFKDLNGTENVGLGFEVRSGVDKVVIEKETYFFDISDNADYPDTDSRPYTTNQILDLSSIVTAAKIQKEVLPDWYANEIESGYSKYEYENIQGLKEFNTKSTYATPIKSVKSKLDLTSPFRYDTQGTNKLREKPYDTDSTEDVNGDNDVFAFGVKRSIEFNFFVKTDEDFSLVTGGIDPEQSYNLNRTPRRNFERHGNRVASMRLAQGDEIQFMETDKNSKLITQLTTEDETKAENGDILVQDLTLGYWIAEAYIFEAPVDETTIAAIQANPYGVIKIASDKYGWILEVQTNNESKIGQFKLLRVDLNNVKVI